LISNHVRQFVTNLGEAGVNETFDYSCGAAPDGAVLANAHVLDHATYHRGQVTTLLRQLGAPPSKQTDMIAFFRTRR
jgi:uncharacterized damage-inducible protein DinB